MTLRYLVGCPYTNRGFVYSTEQTGRGRPEFLFLDTPAIPNLMLGCTKIISNYEACGTIPSNLEVIQTTPFHPPEVNDYPEFCFVARVLMPTNKNNNNHNDDNDLVLLQMLQRQFLRATTCALTHGLVVMIPIMKEPTTRFWGIGDIPVPTKYTNQSLDGWLHAMIHLEKKSYQQQEQTLPRDSSVCGCRMLGCHEKHV